jgi:hypothetical protein
MPLVGLALMLARGTAEAVGKEPRLNLPGRSRGNLQCFVPSLAIARRLSRGAKLDTGATVKPYSNRSENWLAHGNLRAYVIDLPERRADTIDHFETALRLAFGCSGPSFTRALLPTSSKRFASSFSRILAAST